MRFLIRPLSKMLMAPIRVLLLFVLWAGPLAADLDEMIRSYYDIHREAYAIFVESLFSKTREELISTPIDIEIMKDFDAYLSDFLKQIMGQTLFQISGYYTYPSLTGVYGNGEINHRVRITFINGILTCPDNQIESLEMFSSTHMRTNIHYILRPVKGWTHDIIGCFYSKLGFISEQAQVLAAKWRELIHDMGGLDGGGVIIHYAHSIGGTETLLAHALLSDEERQMIRVYTIGSPTLIPKGCFKEVVNYVSRRDGVCLLDPLRFFQGLVDPDCNIVYLDTFAGVPIVDHPLSVPSYQGAIQELSSKFKTEFATN